MDPKQMIPNRRKQNFPSVVRKSRILTKKLQLAKNMIQIRNFGQKSFNYKQVQISFNTQHCILSQYARKLSILSIVQAKK